MRYLLAGVLLCLPLSLFARITSCIMTLQSVHLEVLTTKQHGYRITIPDEIQDQMMVVEEDEKLYVTEHRSAGGASIQLFIPEDTSVSFELFCSASVNMNRVGGSVHAALTGQSTLCLQDGACQELTASLLDASTLVGPELWVDTATITAEGEVDIVLQHVRQFARCDLLRGAQMVHDMTSKMANKRFARAPLSVIAAYRAAGANIDERLAFYGAIAVEPEVRTGAQCENYEGTVFRSRDSRVKEILAMMEHQFEQPGAATRICRKIKELPASYMLQRELLGALLCRRLMLCVLAKPIGTGAISPRSLYEAGAAPASEQNNVAAMWDHMWRGAHSLVMQNVCNQFGLFGHFFAQAIRHIEQSRELSQADAWQALFAKVYKNTDAFIVQGHKVWA